MDDYLFDSALSYRQGLVEECHHKEIQLHEATFFWEDVFLFRRHKPEELVQLKLFEETDDI